MKGFARVLLATTLLTGVAHADELDDLSVKFINASGFEQLDLITLLDSLDDLWVRTELMTPWGEVSPIEMAMLYADNGIDSTRTRSAISYGQIPIPNAGPTDMYSFLEVRHYNLGPVIHEDAVAAYGAENVDDASAFGLGEHRAWRFLFRPLMNNKASLIDASSREIPHEEALTDDCSGIPCLDLSKTYNDIGFWRGLDASVPDWLRLYPDVEDGVATPAHAIAELAVFGYWANAESGDYQWTGGEHPEGARSARPFRFIAIDRNLGQEASIDAVWRETLLNDDELSEISFRRIDIAGDVSFQRYSVTRENRP